MNSSFKAATRRRTLGEIAALLIGPEREEEKENIDMTQEKLEAIRFAIEFSAPEKLSLKALCEECGYSTPTLRLPYAEKIMADGSAIRIARDDKRKTVLATWNGPIEDWGTMRFATDTLYRDLATVGLVKDLPVT